MFPSTPSWEALESVAPGPGFLPAFGCSVGGCGRHGCPWLEAQDAWGSLPSTQFSQGVGPCLYRGNVGMAQEVADAGGQEAARLSEKRPHSFSSDAGRTGGEGVGPGPRNQTVAHLPHGDGAGGRQRGETGHWPEQSLNTGFQKGSQGRDHPQLGEPSANPGPSVFCTRQGSQPWARSQQRLSFFQSI